MAHVRERPSTSVRTWHDSIIKNVFPGRTKPARQFVEFLKIGPVDMPWLNFVSWFFGGFFFANAVPHYVSGIMGHPFQTPFARPRGHGLSSSTANVLWGTVNLVLGYVLVCRVGHFNLRSPGDVIAPLFGMLAISLYLARHFGRFNGGNTPRR
jgi:hypothetical protein